MDTNSYDYIVGTILGTLVLGTLAVAAVGLTVEIFTWNNKTDPETV